MAEPFEEAVFSRLYIGSLSSLARDPIAPSCTHIWHLPKPCQEFRYSCHQKRSVNGFIRGFSVGIEVAVASLSEVAAFACQMNAAPTSRGRMRANNNRVMFPWCVTRVRPSHRR